MTIEKTILSNLVFNEQYARKTIPFLKEEYFKDNTEKRLFRLLDEYVKKYNAFPSKEALVIDSSAMSDHTEQSFKDTQDYINALSYDPSTKEEWLLNQTEKFCQDQALFNAISKSIQLMSSDKSSISKGSIPQILADALAVSFDTHIGHSFLDDWETRFNAYHIKESKIPFDLDYFNKITQGGLSPKTLNICLAGTGVGKSMFMCHCATGNLMAGYNVLYITLEMSEEKIAERIDANTLNVTIDELSSLSRDVYEKKINKARAKTVGKLIIKEYPTASASAANFRYLLNELKIKRNFVPDIVYIDYLNICTSSRLKAGTNFNSYTYIKAIAEELRGLAVEFNVPIISATQTNRGGFGNSDVELTDTSESFGLPATADFMFAIITSEQLNTLNQLMVKQLKNRYSDPNMYRKFVIGVDRSKMRLYNLEQRAQDNIIVDSVDLVTKPATISPVRKPSFQDFT